MGQWLTILIPTRDSAAWIGTLLAHYRARNFVPVILFDVRSADGTRGICESAGAKVVDIHDFSFTESIVHRAKDCVTTPWALFIHDDEIPSDRLFSRLAGPPPPAPAQSVAIPRRWAWYEPGQPLAYGWSELWQDRANRPGSDHGWRLFRPGQVEYVSVMHSEGFFIDRWSRFQPDTYIIHFEWVIRSRAQRLAKLRRYDAHRWGYGRFFEKFYLPETQPAGVITYRPFETAAYDELAAAYYAARKPEQPPPPLGLRARWTRARNFVAAKLRPPDFSAEPDDRKGLDPKLDHEIIDPVA